METNQPAAVQASSERSFHVDGSVPVGDVIWVFGSNLAGRHGAGAALVAKNKFGAKLFTGVGRTGQAYAIPTKDGRSVNNLMAPSELLGLDEVKEHIERFIEYAQDHPELAFFVTRIGCGLARGAFNDEVIAPLFRAAPSNCSFAAEWRKHIDHINQPVPARPRPR